MKRTLLLALLGCFGALGASAQTPRHVVQGRVVDVDGEGLPGVTVEVQNQRVGTVSDIDGNYRLETGLDAGTYSVAFRSVGFGTQTFPVTFSAAQPEVTLNVTLRESAVDLDEVIVTGASPTTTRRQLGNSISVVNAASLQDLATPNPLAGLGGRVIGAQVTQNSGDPSGGFSLRLRGLSSIKGNGDPLYIIDGVIVDNSSTNVINLSGDAMTTGGSWGANRLVDINPNDIERIEVLNGAAAAAIYGSRAANGVVQIFTRRGQSGRPRIEFSASVGMNSLRKQTFMSSYGERFGIKGNDRLETAQDRLTTINTLGLTEAQLIALGLARGAGYDRYGNNPTYTANRLLLNQKYAVQRYNYWDEIFAPSYSTDQNLSIAGGRDQTQYFVSLGRADNGGIVRNTDFGKYTGRVRLDQQLARWANLSMGLALGYTKSNDMPVGTNFFSPVSTVYIIDNVWDITERDAEGNLKQVEAVRVNPLSVIETFKLTQTNARTTGNVGLDLFPLKGLTVKGVLGIDTYGLTGTEFHPRLPYELFPNGSANVAADFFPDGYVSVAKSNVFLLNADATASYDYALSPALQSTTTAGYSYQYDRNNFTTQQGRNLSGFVETFRAASNFFAPSTESRAERAIFGGFLQQTFGYQNSLFVTLAGRLDGSSAFAPDNRNQFYPKASVSYLVSDLWKNNAAMARQVSSLKLRASYGQAGNLTGIGPYDRFNNYLITPINGLSAINASRTLGNPDVKPERMTEIEVGTDASFLDNRLGLALNVYGQTVRDLLFDVPLPASAGGTGITSNIGDENTRLLNRGLEVQLTGNAVRRRNLSVDLGLTFSRNSNEVKGAPGVIALRGSDGAQYVVDGQPFGVFYGRYYARNADGSWLTTTQGLPQPARGVFGASERTRLGARLVDDSEAARAMCETAPAGDQSMCATLGANGQPIGTELRKILGSPDPDWTGGLSMDLRFRRFTFRTLFDAAQGQEVYNWNRITSNNVGFGEIAEKELRGEVPRGTSAAIAGGIVGQRIQEEHVEDASFVKWREVSLGYDFGRVGPWFQNLGLTLSGRNLVSWDDYTGFDPETNAAGQSDRVRGDDFGNVPIPRTITLRLNARF